MQSIQGMEIADDLLVSLCLRSERMAELVIAFIERYVPDAALARSLPFNFLLELGALLQLCCWESEGIELSMLNLPTSDVAADDLAQRYRTDRKSFDQPDGAPLNTQVLRVFVDDLHWLSPFTLGHEFVISCDELDDDTLAKLVQLLL